MTGIFFNKRRGISLVALMAGLGGGCQSAHGWSSPLDGCVNNLRAIEGAVDEWALVNNLSATNSYSLSDTNILYRGKPIMLVCPEGGEYLAGKTIQDEPICTIHGTPSTALAIYEERLRRERQQYVTRVSVVIAVVGLGIVISIGWWLRTKRLSKDQLHKHS